MTHNEIKKEIYKTDPVAYLRYIHMGVAYYYCEYRDTSKDFPTTEHWYFEVPVDDMGTAKFENIMRAKHLLRWLI